MSLILLSKGCLSERCRNSSMEMTPSLTRTRSFPPISFFPSFSQEQTRKRSRIPKRIRLFFIFASSRPAFSVTKSTISGQCLQEPPRRPKRILLHLRPSLDDQLGVRGETISAAPAIHQIHDPF